VDSKEDEMSRILERVAELVLQETKTAVQDHFAFKVPSAASNQAFGASLRDFLARVQVCLMSHIDEHLQAERAAAATLSEAKVAAAAASKDAKTADGKAAAAKPAAASSETKAADGESGQPSRVLP
jgi:hypothetical protein